MTTAWRPLVTRALPIIAVMAIGITTSACGGNDLALAQQACTHVNRSLALYKESQQVPPPPNAASLEIQASEELSVATPLAAQAASYNTAWQALMTTLSESNRVNEAYLVSALTQQCAQVDGIISNQVPSPSTSGPSGTKPQYGGG